MGLTPEELFSEFSQDFEQNLTSLPLAKKRINTGWDYRHEVLDFSRIRVENLPWGFTIYRITPWYEAPDGWDPDTAPKTSYYTRVDFQHRERPEMVARVYKEDRQVWIFRNTPYRATII